MTKEEQREYHKKYRAEHAEELRQKSAEYRRLNHEKLREGKRQYYLENRKEIREKQNALRRADPEKTKEAKRASYLRTRDRVLARSKEYRTANPEVIKRRKREYYPRRNELRNARYREDPEFWLETNLRNRVGAAMRAIKGKKSASTVKLLGCNLASLREHLASQFLPGMSWKNHGQWHVDHIRPRASFDLTDPEQQKQCFHYTNLQPLWAGDNFRKHDKWSPPDKPISNAPNETPKPKDTHDPRNRLSENPRGFPRKA